MPIRGNDDEVPTKNWSDDDWSEIIDFIPYSLKSNYVCEMIIFQDKLYIIWGTNSSVFSDGEDLDIVMRTYDGKNWSEIIEITPINDNSSDLNPSLAIFENKLFFVWETRVPIDSGQEYDVLYRIYDGIGWSNVTSLTEINDAISNHNPVLTVFKDNLYATWPSKSLSSNEVSFITRKFNGNDWSEPIYIAPKSTEYRLGSPHDITIFNNTIYFSWWECDFKNKDDERIFVRGYDGEAFGNIYEISINESDPYPGAHMGGCTPKLIAYNGKLYAIWFTDRHIKSHGDEFRDGDLLIAEFNEINWSYPEIISPGNDFGLDSNPSLFIHNNMLN